MWTAPRRPIGSELVITQFIRIELGEAFSPGLMKIISPEIMK
jgi:hypothetical protein